MAFASWVFVFPLGSCPFLAVQLLAYRAAPVFHGQIPSGLPRSALLRYDWGGCSLYSGVLVSLNTGRWGLYPQRESLSFPFLTQHCRNHHSGNPRSRKRSPKLRQTQLPLEIVSKGRFDKSEPTIHKGEDLDVPTYIRRGVALN